jgi:hypothetical protein
LLHPEGDAVDELNIFPVVFVIVFDFLTLFCFIEGEGAEAEVLLADCLPAPSTFPTDHPGAFPEHLHAFPLAAEYGLELPEEDAHHLDSLLRAEQVLHRGGFEPHQAGAHHDAQVPLAHLVLPAHRQHLLHQELEQDQDSHLPLRLEGLDSFDDLVLEVFLGGVHPFLVNCVGDDGIGQFTEETLDIAGDKVDVVHIFQEGIVLILELVQNFGLVFNGGVLSEDTFHCQLFLLVFEVEDE